MQFDPGHADSVHDAAFDYYGRRLATASSDKTVKIFDVVGDQHIHLATLSSHEGPVWQCAWSHPSFGSLLASCAFDHRVIVWKEQHDGQWHQVFISPPTLHTASVNSISWAPHELGLLLAAGSSDGTISVTEYSSSDGSWSSTKLPGVHAIGVTAVSWAPAVPAGPKAAPGSFTKRIVSSGCDNTIRVWQCSEAGIWSEQESLQAHTDWVRDVAWAPNLGLPRSVMASGGQDGQVFAWSEKASGGWERKLVHDFRPQPVWRVSWSLTGNILAVSDGGNQVTLWKEAMDGLWQQVVN